MLQPKFRALMRGLEKQFITMGQLAGPFLQGKQLIGPQIAFVVGAGRSGKHGSRRLVHGRG